ncbi:MAG: replication-associated recombination protein A [Deltaproteobacteria bacterium]|nr:replication-associated recombination protein A [Deltaproteobacteria bacterium]
MSELFTLFPSQKQKELESPLADRMRPVSLDEIVGQKSILGNEKPLRQQIKNDHLPSLILWGPPGSGKTTIARVIAQETKAAFYSISAVMAGVKELKEILEIATRHRRLEGKKTILFVDEIHRWNKAQQDALLHHLEDGTITLIGATTENPSFEVIGPLLSRTKVYVLNPLSLEDLKMIVQRALQDSKRGFGKMNFKIDEDALSFICETSDGDARRALNTLEIATNLITTPSSGAMIRRIDVEQALQKKSLLYDKSGEEHYNLISAFIKSMRGSDPDAAIYYLARMLEAGEEPLFLARRMVIFASEDVGNADPQAIQVAISAMQAFDFVGMPEGWIPLAQAATYLASAPKSNASYMAYKKAKEDVEKEGALPTPKHIRNAPTKLMKELDYGKGYRYPHHYEGHYVKEEYLPEKLRGKKYYDPSENGHEKEIKEHLCNLNPSKNPRLK